MVSNKLINKVNNQITNVLSDWLIKVWEFMIDMTWQENIFHNLKLDDVSTWCSNDVKAVLVFITIDDHHSGF